MHPFHQTIGNLITEDIFQGCRIFKDRACDPNNNYKIYLSKPGISRYSDVDVLILSNKGSGVIIEIEESVVTPINVFGKFFACAFSDHYRLKNAKPLPLPTPMLFVQVLLKKPNTKSLKPRHSLKPEQWRHIEKQIQEFLKIPLKHFKDYALFQGKVEAFGSESAEFLRLKEKVKTFLERNP